MHRKLARSRDCSTGVLDDGQIATRVEMSSVASEESMPKFETVAVPYKCSQGR